MFEIQPKKSDRLIIFKNNEQSKTKIRRKQAILSRPKIFIDTIQTDKNFKQKKSKSKSQCLSKDKKRDKKSSDVSKFLQTTRSKGSSKNSKDKKINNHLMYDQLLTEDKIKNQSTTVVIIGYLISDLTAQKSAQLKWNRKNSLKRNIEGRSNQKRRSLWNERNIPYDWSYTLEHYSHYLTKYEQVQIKQYKKIYYTGHKANKRQKIDYQNSSFDNEKEYIFVENDHVTFRYQLLSIIGKGSYGQVFKAFDHKNKEEIAIKIIKNQPKFSKQAFIEIKILSHIKQADQQQQSNIVRIKDFVIFRKHVCILFELLSDNLYQLIIRNNYNGLNEELIRRFAIQILVTLQFLRNNKIIHCDLKPENILLKEYNKSGIKVIDFGSSCFQKETIYTYIQSRYYRAPEITLGLPYNQAIDIWSAGCILMELYTGVPVFPGENQYEQMKYMTDALGIPPKSLLAKCNRRSVFFDEETRIKPQINSLSSTLEIFSKKLSDRIEDKDFLLFISSFLKWAPQDRISPLEALSHHWIKKGLPEQLKNKIAHQMLRDPSKYDNIKPLISKSKQKRSNSIKISKRKSQQRLKKQFGLKQ